MQFNGVMHHEEAHLLAHQGRAIAHMDWKPDRFVMYVADGLIEVLLDSESNEPTCWKSLVVKYGSHGWRVHKEADTLLDDQKFLDQHYFSDQLEVLQASLDEVIPLLDKLLDLAQRGK